MSFGSPILASYIIKMVKTVISLPSWFMKLCGMKQIGGSLKGINHCTPRISYTTGIQSHAPILFSFLDGIMAVIDPETPPTEALIPGDKFNTFFIMTYRNHTRPPGWIFVLTLTTVLPDVFTGYKRRLGVFPAMCLQY